MCGHAGYSPTRSAMGRLRREVQHCNCFCPSEALVIVIGDSSVRVSPILATSAACRPLPRCFSCRSRLRCGSHWMGLCAAKRMEATSKKLPAARQFFGHRIPGRCSRPALLPTCGSSKAGSRAPAPRRIPCSGDGATAPGVESSARTTLQTAGRVSADSRRSLSARRSYSAEARQVHPISRPIFRPIWDDP
jgi:hypothetical protein